MNTVYTQHEVGNVKRAQLNNTGVTFLWSDAIYKEMSDAGIAFEILDDSVATPVVGWSKQNVPNRINTKQKHYSHGIPSSFVDN